MSKVNNGPSDPLGTLRSGLSIPAHVESLQQEKAWLEQRSMRQLFAEDPQRTQTFSLCAADLHLDFSKNRLRQKTLDRLIQLALASGVPESIAKMYRAEPINHTERRPAFHVALRADSKTLPEAYRNPIESCRERLNQFVDSVHQHKIRGFTGKPIDNIVNIGIGGSDLGPSMCVEALAAYRHPDLNFYFVSNVDPVQLELALRCCAPETTLFIIASKTFTTQETLCNARRAREWLATACTEPGLLDNHFAAVTAHPQRAVDFGVKTDQVFPIWDWIGGRYSIWSAIGLPLQLALGNEQFAEFLLGARKIDEHFKTAPLQGNMPSLLALISIWYSNFYSSQSHAVICYEQYLEKFADYLQQLDMESNGKSRLRNGRSAPWTTGVPVWGGAGTNTQHSFHQLLHQGNVLIPTDFIVGLESPVPGIQQHALLFANCLAQSRALMYGKTRDECYQELIESGMADSEAEILALHKTIAGNKPSNMLVYPRLTPSVLGQLIALYEHKIFVQSIIWNINAFDQWGVELGKKICSELGGLLLMDTGSVNNDDTTALDSSTSALLTLYRKHNNLD